MARRKHTTAKVANAARRNIKRAQLARLGRREPRSIGRETRKRERYSRPTGYRTVIGQERRTRT